MSDFLDVLAKDAQETVDSGYYETVKLTTKSQASLRKAIIECKFNPVITEIKAASPSAGTIRANIHAIEIAEAMEKGGAVGISVLTEPKHFNGSLQMLAKARQAVKLPILMKDIIICIEQIEVAAQIGASAVLFIEALFERRNTEMEIERMISFAHSKGLEVLLETHTDEEFLSAIETEADFIGINNRNLGTLKIDLNATREILEKHKNLGKTVISESGITTSKDLQFLRNCGARAFLIGSAIMLTDDIESKVQEFVNA